jgi:hypothetical protein
MVDAVVWEADTNEICIKQANIAFEGRMGLVSGFCEMFDGR